MDATSRALLAAADAWFTAMQAVTAANEVPRQCEAEQAAFDTHEVELAVAVMVWRDAGRP